MLEILFWLFNTLILFASDTLLVLIELHIFSFGKYQIKKLLQSVLRLRYHRTAVYTKGHLTV